MNPINRRRFLKRSGAGAAGVALTLSRGGTRPARAARPARIPPHRAITIEGVHAYADRMSVAAGETISFHVSNTVPTEVAVFRLGLAVDDPAKDELVAELSSAAARPQPIHPGSYVHVAKGLPASPRALTVELWVRPSTIEAPGTLVSQTDGATGLVLAMTAGGKIAFRAGAAGEPPTGDATAAAVLRRDRWHHVAAVWDGAEKRVYVDGAEAGRWPAAGPLALPAAPLRLGAAAAADGRADHFLDGDLAMPALHEAALDLPAIAARVEAKGRSPATGPAVLACWPLAEERGARVSDGSRHRRHGAIVNHATWMIGGPSLGAEPPRYGAYDPARDEARGHGLRLAADDLYDCRWEPTHSLRIPKGARPGYYVARLRYELEGKPHLYHVSFVVRRAARRKKAPLLLLAATNTWLAYNAAPFAPRGPGPKWVSNDRVVPPHRDVPVFSFYKKHAGGQGTYQLGLRMPWPGGGPYVVYGGPTDYSHLLRAERFTQVWLEQGGFDYDVVTDLDLHREPELLRGYQAVVVNGHNEYWSTAMYRGLDQYLAKGGRLVCLSGNTMFWRVSFDPEGSVMECRKADAPGNQIDEGRRGELWHSHDGARGGLMRECGLPAYPIIGLECIGWNAHTIPAHFGAYVVEDGAHPLLTTPEPTGLRAGDRFLEPPDGALPRGNGHEFDVRPSVLLALQEKPTPEGAPTPADPPGIALLATGIMPWSRGGHAMDYYLRGIKPKKEQGGEMIYWERPAGGTVFNAGTIGAGWLLAHDERFAKLLRNVLHAFGVRPAAKAT